MKKSSSFLYDLIHTLTKSEKRYIKVNANSGEKDYVQLLDAILKQPYFDEDRLIKENQGANFLRHLAVNKAYLYDLILQSLVKFGQKSIQSKIKNKITAVTILLEKGMVKAAYVALQKGKKLAEENEFFELQLDLFRLEKELIAQKNYRVKSDAEVETLFAAETKCLQQIQNTNEYWFLAFEMSRFQKQYQKIQTDEQALFVKKITDSPRFRNVELATSFRSKIYYYQANAVYHFTLGDVEKAYAINREFLDLLEGNAIFLKLYSVRYLGTLNNMLIDSLGIGKYDILEEGINRLKKLPERSEFSKIKDIESRVFRQQYLLLLNWSIRQKDIDKALVWIPEIEAGLEKYGKKIEKHHRVTFYYLSAYILMLSGKYESALEWNNLVLFDTKEDVVKEIYYFSRSLNLLIHFGLGNFSLLDSLLVSTPKYLRSRRVIYKAEKRLFLFLGKMIKSLDRQKKVKLKEDFTADLNELSSQVKETRLFSYLDLRDWVKSW